MPRPDSTQPSDAFLAQIILNPAQDAFVRCAERFAAARATCIAARRLAS